MPPIIYDVASKQHPNAPWRFLSIASQMGILASPVSVAGGAGGLPAKAPVDYAD
jgi:anaerobic C4-dicarboxylate transporter